MDTNIAAVTTQLFSLLEPLSSDERVKVARAVFALLGDELPAVAGGRPVAHSQQSSVVVETMGHLPPRATSWCAQHKLGQDSLENWFYFHEGKVDVHVNSVPGNSKREQTFNCYLLAGLRSFLESDTGRFTDSEAMTLCKHTRAYDKNNHPKFRKALGSLVNGSKDDGFVLTGPGLKEAAALMRKIEV